MGKNIAENTPKKVWIMGYGRVMGYAWHFPANEVGNPENVWSIREYGFIGVWVKRESTVLQSFISFNNQAPPTRFTSYLPFILPVSAS
ncbi:hypothetical protein F5876DRAFT_52187 [Lentinula aff. lateritia]|uniref:Uncharacterized protein n=1 Tax=Lentinula aff. lateritia TaxID=2804960 RepID=A0ACC1TKF4_9AGAR|nr:hypothetical protein F5876DRAFT_52187 [Lentinula aff. lateritia]